MWGEMIIRGSSSCVGRGAAAAVEGAAGNASSMLHQSRRLSYDTTCELLLQLCFGQSLRLRQEGCLQAALWDRAEARPAEEQAPLWSAELEGERALHYFETAPPEAACAQLLLLGLGSALHLLAASEGAKLPAARAPLDRCCSPTHYMHEVQCTAEMHGANGLSNADAAQ